MTAESSTVAIYPRRQQTAPTFASSTSSLPTLLQTPAGLALLELQGTFNFPDAELHNDDGNDGDGSGNTITSAIPIGRLDFPEYDLDAPAGSTDWMHRVHLYVGPHQRLTGEVKKLPKPLAVVRRQKADGDGLEVVEIIYYKLQFSQRPEPMTESAT